MSLLATGTIAIDSVETPFGRQDSCLGGSAIYFSVAASHFAPVRLVGVVGEDFPGEYLKIFEGRNVDASGLETRAGSLTFRWKGSYTGAMNEARTLETKLNVIAEAPPVIPAGFRNSKYVFLANTAPHVQMQLLGQVDAPRLVVADTMNYWIENTRPDLEQLLSRINGLVLNDTEARMFSGQDNLVAAAKAIVKMGLAFVVIKKGEHGAMLFTSDQECCVLGSYPTDAVKDPTGAGDSFAGGMMGYLAGQDGQAVEFNQLKKAIAYGTVAASFVIEDFSLNCWRQVGRNDIERRFRQLRNMIRF